MTYTKKVAFWKMLHFEKYCISKNDAFWHEVCINSKRPKKMHFQLCWFSLRVFSDTWKNLDWRSCIKFSEVEIRKVSAWSGSAINRMSLQEVCLYMYPPIISTNQKNISIGTLPKILKKCQIRQIKNVINEIVNEINTSDWKNELIWFLTRARIDRNLNRSE